MHAHLSTLSMRACLGGARRCVHARLCREHGRQPRHLIGACSGTRLRLRRVHPRRLRRQQRALLVLGRKDRVHGLQRQFLGRLLLGLVQHGTSAINCSNRTAPESFFQRGLGVYTPKLLLAYILALLGVRKTAPLPSPGMTSKAAKVSSVLPKSATSATSAAATTPLTRYEMGGRRGCCVSYFLLENIR